MPRRPAASQATIARLLKGARDAGLVVARVEIDPATGRITLFADIDNLNAPTVLETWRAALGAR